MSRMRIKQYQDALANPAQFVRTYINSREYDTRFIAEVTKLPYNTVRSFITGARPNTSTRTMTVLLRFVLIDSGEVNASDLD